MSVTGPCLFVWPQTILSTSMHVISSKAHTVPALYYSRPVSSGWEALTSDTDPSKHSHVFRDYLGLDRFARERLLSIEPDKPKPSVGCLNFPS